jgi:hypothetical protein
LEELACGEQRLAKLAEARAKHESRAKERFEREPLEAPQAKDQINLTDEDSRIMPVAGGGFEQCYNARAVGAK